MLIRFLTNSNEEKKIMLMRQDRAMETPSPDVTFRYRHKSDIRGFGSYLDTSLR